ncbi:hypothetical protein [Mesorhizobium sp. M1403]|uniref:hypothetical protein n=1 Tax=Mesorhizobium sp. M1403 TaxID=2957097 RepID=UPI00333862AA
MAFAGALDAMENIRPFYTDASMKTLKPMSEFKVAFMAMPQTKREMMMRECQDATMSKPYAEFCADTSQWLSASVPPERDQAAWSSQNRTRGGERNPQPK